MECAWKAEGNAQSDLVDINSNRITQQTDCVFQDPNSHNFWLISRLDTINPITGVGTYL